MPNPSGTVTFLFTDIEGSTKLWEEHPEALRENIGIVLPPYRRAGQNSKFVKIRLMLGEDAFAAAWVYARSAKPLPAVRCAHLYRHTLATMLNSLLGLGFSLLHMSDSKHIYPDAAAEPGSWDHFVAYAPVYLGLWLRYQPDNFKIGRG